MTPKEKALDIFTKAGYSIVYPLGSKVPINKVDENTKRCSLMVLDEITTALAEFAKPLEKTIPELLKEQHDFWEKVQDEIIKL